MKTFKPNALMIAFLVGGMQLSGVSLHAAELEEDLADQSQNETPAAIAKADEKEVEVIEIKGFRRSLFEAINVKRYSDTVVEVVSADDMGALPDVSIADSITRLPGVTSVRTGGQSSELNIRGLSGSYVFATMNGRELVSNQGGRSVQFDQYPSELINSAQVYKSQKASLIEGGVAGTIELKTVNPLLNKEQHSFNAQLRGSYNDAADAHADADPAGNRFSLSYQGKFLEDTLGVGFGYARLDQPNISTQFVNYQPRCGVIPYDGAAVTSDTDCEGNAVEGGAAKYFVPTGFEIMARGGQDLRDGYMGTFTYAPTKNFKASTDVFYSKFDAESYDRGYRFDGWGALVDGPNFEFAEPVLAGANKDVIVGGTYYGDRYNNKLAAPFPGARIPYGFHIQSDDATINSDVLSIGTNLTWENDDYMLSLDGSHSKGESYSADGVVSIAMFENANAAFPIAQDNTSIRYELNGLQLPTLQLDPATMAALSDPNKMMATSLEKYPNVEVNDANALKADFKYFLENDYLHSFEVGARWAERTHDFDRRMYRYGLSSDFDSRRNGKWVSSWDLTDPNNPVMGQTFPPFALGAGDYSVMNLGGDFTQYGNFIAVNNKDIENKWLKSKGINTAAGKSWENAWTFFESNVVTETTTSAYGQLNLQADVADMPLTGNIGVRVVRSEQRSTGLLAATVPGEGDCITDDFGVENCNYDKVVQGIDYTDVLPSINLNLQLTDSDQLRFAAAKVMSRPEMPDMRVSGSWSFVENAATGQTEANLNASTSPALKPFYATQYDLSYEHYFTEVEGALVVAVFYKDIDSIVQQFTQENFDFAGANIDVPAVDPVKQIPVVPGSYSARFNNGEGGYIRGAEIALTQTFSYLPGLWSGFGFSGNVSYTESELQNSFTAVAGGVPRTTPIPGLSKVVWSAALFYDYDDKFSTRVNVRYREDYIGDQVAVGQNQQAFFLEELITDYQASYQFNENWQGVFSVNNLTDEPNISYFGEQYLTGTLQYFGRQFYLGANAKF